MRFQLRMHGWPFDQYCVPQGTIIDDASNDPWSRMIVARNLHVHPPPNAQPLNQAAYDQMRLTFQSWQIVTVPGYDGINRW
jgi:hypothetical protein